MRNDLLRKYIVDHQLSSCMNDTKWRELIKEINQRDDFKPTVNIKYVTDKENNGLFSEVWWEEVERDGYCMIEWIEINPIKTEHQGRLIKPKTNDFSDFIESALLKHSIPYDLNNGIFKVYGYR